MQKIGLIINENKVKKTTIVKDLRDWLSKRDKQVMESSEDSIDKILKEAELLICLGGDGTILNVAGKMLERSIPVLGVNVGSLGFLSEIKAGEVFEELNSIFIGNYNIEERILLSTLVKSKDHPQGRRFQALNDLVIDREGLSRYLRIEVKAGGEPLMNFPGDGVIVATPTGSTAYSLSAGGPFVYPTLDNFIITPLCAHALLARPIVLPTDKKITLSIQTEEKGDRATFTIDGQEKIEITASDSIEITKASLVFKLISSSKRNYLETLREKFGMASR